MKKLPYKLTTLAMVLSLMATVSCSEYLDAPLENKILAEQTDYSQSQNMILLLNGAYSEFYGFQWETFPLISVRGDDVDPAGDQQVLFDTDEFNYGRSFWIYNSTWLNFYSDIMYWNGAIEEIQKYQEAGASASNAAQYIAEIKVMKGYNLLQLARLWNNILIPPSSDPNDLYEVELTPFNEVMQYISDQMDEAMPNLPNVRPNQRTDITGGVTRYTALAIKALANLEMGNYQATAEATGQIISSGEFMLENDYYQLFKIPGKLNNENLLEFQYSDFGAESGTSEKFPWQVYGPQAVGWQPAVPGSSGGWGFWEPTEKYVKFMLDRNDRKRLETTVLFTPDGISAIEADPDYANLPNWVTNVTPDGDTFGNAPRYNFLSGKHYLPTTQLTPGRFNYGENKNMIAIRYAEILLVHAEALVSGASSSVMSADEAVNAVRSRANLTPLNGVTLNEVLDEKFAEFGMEWGVRFFDLVRHGQTSELNYEGRSYQESDRFLPYPLDQVDILPQLQEASNQ
ncbi:RagB/SusD family nutrient uptake outer membrane protein [Echinicola vietnamensis]|uniref:RagB/SusD family protein n=1 Tax=Echinicola vietnamensis (strain DSM 17526 / LMG 23754 / KMM 6221) TaxID=926556 RepID=L0G150_ECHVK|nr:RagB/SusD family nutrient uptake outer membrane protein [Echinicola vietnamensis]AGA78741.1 RagB/SusD family protein [Echinicola vietnamensis DSM 17526]